MTPISNELTDNSAFHRFDCLAYQVLRMLQVMKLFAHSFAVLLCLVHQGKAFQQIQKGPYPITSNLYQRDNSGHLQTRECIIYQSASILGALVIAPANPAFARGRATLDQAYDRYTPRIIAGGEFYKKDLREMVAKNDFQGIKRALAEPPKKSKEDRAKADGGTSERAAQAGGFSDARVLIAADLFAATFSDNSVSKKTKNMKQEVDTLRSVVEQMQSISRQALGEESAGGGLFGFGAKKARKDELSQKLKELYIEGGNAYNRYIFAANDGLPVQLNKLPFL